MFAVPQTWTSWITVSRPGSVTAQLPPWSIDTSTITEPGFMLRTISSVISTGRHFARHQGAEDDDIRLRHDATASSSRSCSSHSGGSALA